MVWARPEDGTGEPLYRRVNEKFEFEPKPIFEVAVRARDGRKETYRATGNHPFWIENNSEETGWTAAEDLKAGDVLRLADGGAAMVVSLTNTDTHEPVYNMDVDGWHTYHVGQLGTWVHNMNCPVRLQSIQDARAPQARDTRLQSIYGELFRPQDRNPGGTAGELLREVVSGGPLVHLDKAQGRARQLSRLLGDRNHGLGRLDRLGAQRVLDDLRVAIQEATK
jgi:hypothetical protein